MHEFKIYAEKITAQIFFQLSTCVKVKLKFILDIHHFILRQHISHIV